MTREAGTVKRAIPVTRRGGQLGADDAAEKDDGRGARETESHGQTENSNVRAHTF